MTINWIVVATIAAPIIALIVGAALNRFMESRPRLLTYIGHVSSFTLQIPAGYAKVFAHSLVVRNAGRKPARNVKVGHSYLPHFELNPSIQCDVQELPSGGHEIIFPTLVPGEQVTVSYLYFPPITWDQINTFVKSDEGIAKVITVLPTEQYPRWVRLILQGFLLIGVIASLYVAFVVIKSLC